MQHLKKYSCNVCRELIVLTLSVKIWMQVTENNFHLFKVETGR